ncbi:PEP-CTERM sorting domain-containing protein [Mariniblastus sp.]|nr:PEP-CTERM sorting domain-containing protein [Mariniblastus sp.]
MTHVLKNSLLVLAVAFVAVAQTSYANAQDVPTSADVGEANAILDLATGEVTLQIGAGLQVFGIEGVPFDNAAARNGLFLIDPPPLTPPTPQGPGTQNDENGIGVLNTSLLPTGTFSLGNILLPDFRTEAALADFVFRFDGPGNTDRVNNPVSAPDHVFFINGEAIPEPSSWNLLVLAGLGAVARRRR